MRKELFTPLHTFNSEFIKNYLNKENSQRLIESGPNTDRIETLQKHSENSKPTVYHLTIILSRSRFKRRFVKISDYH